MTQINPASAFSVSSLGEYLPNPCGVSSRLSERISLNPERYSPHKKTLQQITVLASDPEAKLVQESTLLSKQGDLKIDHVYCIIDQESNQHFANTLKVLNAETPHQLHRSERRVVLQEKDLVADIWVSVKKLFHFLGEPKKVFKCNLLAAAPLLDDKGNKLSSLLALGEFYSVDHDSDCPDHLLLAWMVLNDPEEKPSPSTSNDLDVPDFDLEADLPSKEFSSKKAKVVQEAHVVGRLWVELSRKEERLNVFPVREREVVAPPQINVLNPVESLRSSNPEALAVLSIALYLEGQSIPKSILKLGTTAPDDLNMDATLETLTSFGLLKKRDDSSFETFSIQESDQRALMNQISDSEKKFAESILFEHFKDRNRLAEMVVTNHPFITPHVERFSDLVGPQMAIPVLTSLAANLIHVPSSSCLDQLDFFNGEKTSKTDSDTAVRLLKKGIRLAEQGGCEEIDIANLHLILGFAYKARGDVGFATESVKKALEVSPGSQNSRLIGSCFYILGALHLSQRQYQQAITCYEQAIEASSENSLDRASSLVKCGEICELQREYGQASSYYLKVLEIYDDAANKNVNPGLRGYALACLSSIHTFIEKNNQLGSKYFEVALSIANRQEIGLRDVETLIKLVKLHEVYREQEEAKVFYEETLRLIQDLRLTRDLKPLQDSNESSSPWMDFLKSASKRIPRFPQLASYYSFVKKVFEVILHQVFFAASRISKLFEKGFSVLKSCAKNFVFKPILNLVR